MIKKKTKTTTSVPVAPKILTLEQRTKMLFKPCANRQELKNWIKYHLGMDLPDCTASRYADTNPLDSIWEIYDICVNGNNPQNVEELLYVASRGSGKTLGVAIAEFMVMLHDQRDVVHVGAIMSQAKRCYEYQTKFMRGDRVRPILEQITSSGGAILEKANMEKSVLSLTDRYTKQQVKVSLEVLPCTLKAVNGPHVSLVSVDEIDTVQGEGLRAFKDIAGMLDSRGQRKALKIGISTRKSRYGLMNKQIEDAEKAGRSVRRWTTLEFSERCPDKRSGLTPTVGYVLQDTMEVITEEEFQRKDKQKRGDFFANEFPGQNCLNCPLAAACLGDAKRQTCTSTMLKPIADAIKKTRENGADWCLSQLFNLKPSIEGIVYKEFEEKQHVKTWNQMWQILTGQEYPGECTHDVFIKKCHQMKLSAYGAIDWGWSSPSTVVFAYIDNRENVYVVRCEGQTYTNNPTWVQTIKHKWHHMYRVQLYFPDLANPGDGMTMRQEGLSCPTEQVKDTKGGIQVVKKWLKSLASPVPKIFIAKDTCFPLIQEFQLYHFKTDAAGVVTDDPDTEHDHWLDALRYMLYGLFAKNKMVMAMGNDDMIDRATDRKGDFTRTPNAEEFAYSRGIKVVSESEIDRSKLGQLGPKSELDDDDNDSGNNGGSGGFLWNF